MATDGMHRLRHNACVACTTELRADRGARHLATYNALGIARACMACMACVVASVTRNARMARSPNRAARMRGAISQPRELAQSRTHPSRWACLTTDDSCNWHDTCELDDSHALSALTICLYEGNDVNGSYDMYNVTTCSTHTLAYMSSCTSPSQYMYPAGACVHGVL